jgi:hypothetical protein
MDLFDASLVKRCGVARADGGGGRSNSGTGLTRRVHRRSVPPCEPGEQRAALCALLLLPRVTLAVGFQYSLTLFFLFLCFLSLFLFCFWFVFVFPPSHSHSRLPCVAGLFAKISWHGMDAPSRPLAEIPSCQWPINLACVAKSPFTAVSARSFHSQSR